MSFLSVSSVFVCFVCISSEEEGAVSDSDLLPSDLVPSDMSAYARRMLSVELVLLVRRDMVERAVARLPGSGANLHELIRWKKCISMRVLVRVEDLGH